MSMQKYKVPREIDHGKDGAIFQIAQGIIAKICWGNTVTQKEADIAAKAYEKGISIPIPYGIQPITFPDKKMCGLYANRTFNGFVMEKVEGKTGIQLRNPDEKAKAHILLDREIKKAFREGFIPRDARHPENYILTPNNEIKLFDFAYWTYDPKYPYKIHY